MKNQAEHIKWLQKIARKDISGMESLFDQYSGVLFGLLMNIAGNESLAACILEKTFLRLWAEAWNFNPEKDQLCLWLIKLTGKTATSEPAFLSFMNENIHAIQLNSSFNALHLLLLSDYINKIENNKVPALLHLQGKTIREELKLLKLTTVTI